MSDYGLKISLPGFDVLTATPEQCSVHSDFASPKIEANPNKATINNTIGNGIWNFNGFNFNTLDWQFTEDPPDGTYDLLVLPHGKPYVPMALVFAIDQNTIPESLTQLPIQPVANPFFGSFLQKIRYYTDGTSLHIQYQRLPGGSPTDYVDINGFSYIFKYYLFVENGE